VREPLPGAEIVGKIDERDSVAITLESELAAPLLDPCGQRRQRRLIELSVPAIATFQCE
jgi:hypothetical protein